MVDKVVENYRAEKIIWRTTPRPTLLGTPPSATSLIQKAGRGRALRPTRRVWVCYIHTSSSSTLLLIQ
jgi:hypothetical protein